MKRALRGQPLIREPRPGEDRGGDRRREEALLVPLGERDDVLGRYIRSARNWATVTPVVLPFLRGPDRAQHEGARGAASVPSIVRPEDEDRIPHRTAQEVQKAVLRAEKQFLKAIRHAGLPLDLLEEFELRAEPYWPGTAPARHYFLPDHLKNAIVCHVRLRWKIDVSGPLSIGGGRFCGLGLFAATDWD
jgi:CRISPR-associated protein Csb2